MFQRYTLVRLRFAALLLVIAAAYSCKKDNTKPQNTNTTVNPVVMGLYEYAIDTNKRVFIPITKIGTNTTAYYGIFDTGSTGMTIDAHDLIPASMITSTGIQFTGDSTVVNGITITSQTSTISYGNSLSLTKEYGNLAYASVTIGNSDGSFTVKRLPFFLYYKIVSGTGTVYPAHSNDVFGVGPGVSYTSSKIASPLSYFDTGSNLTSGFKLATLSMAQFNSNGNYVSSLLTVGLTSSDLTSAGFIMHPLSPINPGGYSPNIPSTITYGSKSVSSNVLFDTGTPALTIIEDKTAVRTIGQLPANTVVKVTTNKGFVYQYTTTSTENLTEVQNPNNTNDFRTIFSLSFFIENEYLTDYKNHQIGLKNN
ncbi:pepsin/retropepsin-like aspartic protease family protein [Mucilaginibacter ginsenosidivorans]|uniref:Aspartyl protease n=1 Tax=Mucilaginibacter ginsenosidivorans TaxID=398053 RepID=A0A5B8UUR0_9SPHI|nr:hypothetical protein [Mucilaginibacter ginsenosidivorans]QEC62166.1 hypothetical protein FRZ54_06070 [Mucilaginibacter ginsenosidivorans]